MTAASEGGRRRAGTELTAFAGLVPEALDGLRRERRAEAERQLLVPTVSIASEDWRPDRGQCAYLVVDGMLLRRLLVGGGGSVELLGPGDVLFPLGEDSVSFSRAEWEVVDRARLAVVDLRAGAPASRWPSVSTALLRRAIWRTRWWALQAAAMSIVGVEERLHVLLWAFAERWGRPHPRGAEVDVPVPQGVLAELVGARRPSVSLALRELGERGLVRSSGRGRWTLCGPPPAPPG